MSPLVTDGVIIAILGGIVSLLTVGINRRGSRESAIIDLVAKRLDSAERRLDVLEQALDRERERSSRLRRLAHDLASWSHHAWIALRRVDPNYPEPPGPPRVEEEE